MIELVVGVLLGAGLLFLYLFPGLVRRELLRMRADAPPRAPEARPEPGADEPPVDPFLLRIYGLQRRVAEFPTSTPQELAQVRPFRELTEVFSEPEVGTDTVVRYITGDDALVAWAATRALAHRGPDAALE